jgi:multidrug efflux pump subunit AcrB
MLLEIVTKISILLVDYAMIACSGGDASSARPMAWAMIGGLVTSTALSLLVVPAKHWR